MAMQEWEVQQHQSAAVEMCFRLGLSPYEPQVPNGPPMWLKYAMLMAEHEIMVQLMRQYGRPV